MNKNKSVRAAENGPVAGWSPLYDVDTLFNVLIETAANSQRRFDKEICFGSCILTVNKLYLKYFHHVNAMNCLVCFPVVQLAVEGAITPTLFLLTHP